MDAQSNFCENFTKPITVSSAIGNDNMPFRYYDRFGNIYTPDELRIYKNPNIISVRNAYEEGIFILTFQDEEKDNNRGFDDPTFGSDRRTIVRQVFKELSDFLQTPNNNARVRINIKESEILPPSAPGVTRTLGTGSSYYFTYGNIIRNILDGEVSKTINGGVDSYLGLDPSIRPSDPAHGLLQFYFPSGSDNELHYDHSSLTVPATKIDFYTVVLHEVLHCIGFGAGMDQNGNGFFSGNYTRYDSNLRFLDTGSPFLLSFNSPTGNQVTYSANNRTNDLFRGCGTNNGINFGGLNLMNQAVHTPTTWLQGGSLSHLECNPDCNTAQQNVMRACAAQGTNGMFRHPSQAEANALCDLGYRRNNTWGLNPSNTTIRTTYTGCSVEQCAYGVNDRFDSNGNLFEMVGNGSITINNVLNNDRGTNLSIANLQIRSSLGGQPVGTITNLTPTGFTFTPLNNYIGLVVLSYVPVCAGNNNVRGNVTFICLRVKPTPCPAVTAPPCGQNLVCYGDFESTPSIYLYSDFYAESGFNSASMIQRLPSGTGGFDTWNFGTTQSSISYNGCTNNFPTPTGTNNNRYVAISGNFIEKECVALPLTTSLNPSATYRLSFDATHWGLWGGATTPGCETQPTPIFRILGADRAPCNTSERTSTTPGVTLGCGFTPTLIQDINITSTSWTHYVVEFTGQAINHLLLTPLNQTFVFLDNVTLEQINCPVPCQPAGFTAVGTDVNSVTNVSSLVNTGILPASYGQTGTPREQLYVQGTLVIDMGYGFYDSRLKMAPGSRILVNAGSYFDIDQGTVIDGCDQMWKGIQFQSGTSPWNTQPTPLWVWNSTIQDAEFAIAVQRNNHTGAYLSIQNSNFLDNYYNVFIPAKNGTTSVISTYSYVDNCMFANPRGNLKPAYPGQSNYDIKTFSGISATEVPSLIVSNSSFRQMDYGINANTANLNITNTSFQDMPQRTVGLFDWRGFGIVLNNGILNFTGFGRDGRAAIDNVYTGLSLNSAIFNIQNSNMTNCSVGISAYFSQLNTNNLPFQANCINNNRIRASEIGMNLGYNYSLTWVKDNIIAPVSNNLTYGISINEFGYSSNASYWLNSNDITLSSTGSFGGASAIYINNIGNPNSNSYSVAADVQYNRIFVDNKSTYSFASGIKTTYCGQFIIGNNMINGTGLNSSAGIESYNSTGYFQCNGMDNVQNGMLFSGNNLTDQKLLSNHFMHIKQTGLRLAEDAIIGQQNNTGNVWEFDGYSDFAAKHLGTNTAASEIITNPATQYFARNNIFPFGWFSPISNTPPSYCNGAFTTPTLQVRGGEPTEEQVINNVNSSYRTVAEGRNTFQSEAIQNLANRQLLRFLDEKSSDNRLNLNSAFGVFKTKIQNKLEKKQYTWDRDLNDALTLDTIVANKLKENTRLQQEALKKVAADVKALQELEKRDKLATAKAITTDNTLSKLIKERKDFEVEHSKKVEKAKAKLRTDNKSNRGQKLYEQYESDVNDVFIDVTDGKKLNQSQIDQLDAIAKLCPSVGGVAVYKARSILGSLAIYIGKRTWNDWKDCSGIAVEMRSNKAKSETETNNTPKVLAFPNPTDGMLKLVFYDTNASSDAPHTIQIFNTTGGLLKHIELKKLQDTDIDTQGITSGIYILKVTAKDGKWSESVKISVLN